MTTVSIQHLNRSSNTYSVTIGDDVIHTVVTQTPSVVDDYISTILYIHRRRLNRLVVGLDVEWRPPFSRNVYSPVATLQICVGRRCLIFQLLHASYIPQSLVDFLNNPTFQFVGVGIDNDVDKLVRDYNLGVANTVDLGSLAEQVLGFAGLWKAGLKNLAGVVLGREIVKPKHITLSRWDEQDLTYGQIQYACVDAFLSFDIGMALIFGN